MICLKSEEPAVCLASGCRLVSAWTFHQVNEHTNRRSTSWGSSVSTKGQDSHPHKFGAASCRRVLLHLVAFFMPPPLGFHVLGNFTFRSCSLDGDGFAADAAKVHYAVLALSVIVAALPQV